LPDTSSTIKRLTKEERALTPHGMELDIVEIKGSIHLRANISPFDTIFVVLHMLRKISSKLPKIL
jgi:hypothetical protein